MNIRHGAHGVAAAAMAAVALLAGVVLWSGVALFSSPAMASHAVCTVNGNAEGILRINEVSSSTAAIDVNTACNNVDLRTRTGPEVQGTTAVEAGAPGFDPSQLLAFAALDRCIGPLTGTATLESGIPGSTSPNGTDAVRNCRTQGGQLIHGAFSALGPGAVTNNMFGRVITMNGFDAVSFLKTDDGDGIAFGNSGANVDVLLLQGIIVPCTNPIQSFQTGLFTCDLALLGGQSVGVGTGEIGTVLVSGLDADGKLLHGITLASFNMAPNTSSPFTISPAVTVGTGGPNFLVSTNNNFQFINAGGTAAVAGDTCDTVRALNGGAIGKGAAFNLVSINNMITVNTGVSCGVQRITQVIPQASGVEDPSAAVAGANGRVSLVSMVFSWFTQQQAGSLLLGSVAGDITTANTDPRVNFVQLISQGAFNLDANGFFRYNAANVFPTASYPTGRTLSSSVVVNGPSVGDSSACLPAKGTCQP